MQYILDILIIISYTHLIKRRKGAILKNLKLKAARAGMDLSQSDLAELVGVTRQTIGMIEAGRFNPSLRLCLDICRALHKTLDDIFWEEDSDETIR